MTITAASTAGSRIDGMALLRSTSLNDIDGLYRGALIALKAGQEHEALPVLAEAARRHSNDYRMPQALGLLARADGDLETATSAFATAHALAPTDPLVAHSLARSRMEAGLSSLDEFTKALRLAPNDASVIQGMAASYYAHGQIEDGIALIDGVLAREPGWLDGHALFARLRSMAGQRDRMRSYRDAVTLQPQNMPLWNAYLSTALLADPYDALPAVVAAARAATGGSPLIDLYEAIAFDESGQAARAVEVYNRIPETNDPNAIVWQVRHKMRMGQMAEAVVLAEERVDQPGARGLWPYVALGWHVLGDPRWQWLEGQDGLVQIFDLDLAAIDLPSLAAYLCKLHLCVAQPLDQSVRGGTQTDGPLLSNISPEIVTLRAAITQAVRTYIDQLPPIDAQHPLLAPRRDQIRFAGSWSVRLAGGGFHADHVHPQGWISSALYVSLPETADSAAHQGWLTLGAANMLLPDLPPFREIEPKPGRLVLFPSTMWHGTRPFPAGERLTVAFDVALPNP